MRIALTLSTVCILILLAPPTWVLAQIPKTLSYQGVLTDAAGVPKSDGNYQIIFRLYDIVTGGTALWESGSQTVAATRGLFSDTLGDASASWNSLKFDKPYYLGIQVGTDPELSPRMPVMAAAYSQSSRRADTASYVLNPGSPAGQAGGDLAGTYPNPSIGSGTITSAKILDGTIQGTDIASSTIGLTNLNFTPVTSSDIIPVNSANYQSVQVANNSIVLLKERITLTGNYTRLNYYYLLIQGGGFIGTGSEVVSFGNNTTVSGARFKDVLLEGNYTIFYNCEFEGTMRLPHGSKLYGCSLNGVSTGVTYEIGDLQNCQINNSTLLRVARISNSTILASTLGGSGSIEYVNNCNNNAIYSSRIYMRTDSKFTGNTCSQVKLEVLDVADGLITITGNSFANCLSGETVVIYIVSQSASYRSYVVSGNQFIIQSSDPQAIIITGTPTGSYQMLKITGNMFLKGQQAIGYVGNFKTVVSDNVVRGTDIGVSTSGTYLVVINNTDFD